MRFKINLLLLVALCSVLPAAAQTTLYWSRDDGSGFTAYQGTNGTWELTSLTSVPRWATNLGAPVATDLGGWVNGAIANIPGGSGFFVTLTLIDNLSIGGLAVGGISGATIADGSGTLTLTGAAPEIDARFRRALTINVPLVGSAGFKVTSGGVRLNAASPSLSGTVETGPLGLYVGNQSALGTADVVIGVASSPSVGTSSFLIFDAPAAASFNFSFANPITLQFPGDVVFASSSPRIMVESVQVSSVYANRSATLTNALTLASDATLAAGGNSTVTIGRGALGTNTSLIVSGNISEIGGSHRVLLEGDVTLSGSNSFTGRILVGDHANARLTVPVFNDSGSAGPLGAGTGLLLGNHYSNGEGFSNSQGELNYTGGTAASNRTIQIDPGATGMITVANAPAALTLSGVISNNATGNVNFKKDGPGTLSLTAANTYSGATTVIAGTLLVNNVTGSGVGTGTLTVKNGATLGGAGFIGAAVSFESGAHLAPGNSAGTLTFANGLTLNTGLVFDFQLGSVSDLINVAGGTLTGPGGTGGITLNLSDSGGFAPATYVLFDFTGAATLSDFDAGDFALGSTLSGYNYSLAINGNLLELTATSAIPEPATYATLFGIGTLSFAVWRRRMALATTRFFTGYER